MRMLFWGFLKQRYGTSQKRYPKTSEKNPENDTGRPNVRMNTAQTSSLDARVYIYIYAMFVYVYIVAYLDMYVYIYIYIYICSLHIYIYIYTHTHTHTL